MGQSKFFNLLKVASPGGPPKAAKYEVRSKNSEALTYWQSKLKELCKIPNKENTWPKTRKSQKN